VITCRLRGERQAPSSKPEQHSNGNFHPRMVYSGAGVGSAVVNPARWSISFR
jgi:hypothetical protein